PPPASSTSSRASTRTRSLSWRPRAGLCGAGRRCTTTSEASAESGGEARRPTHGGAARRFRLTDRDPPDVAADGAARVHLARPADGRLRIYVPALEAADAGEHVEAVRGGFHTDKMPPGPKPHAGRLTSRVRLTSA